jgi:hypothetical protein
MANSNISLVNLDFDGLKDSFKTHLKAQDKFKDYDFEGSNMNVLLDLLAYNSYMNTFYLNMVGSEMFLDTAKLRDSILSHAKELNYLPRSFKSAKATVALNINSGDSTLTTLTVPKGTSFTSKIGSNAFTFSTDSNQVLLGTNGVFTTAGTEIYEGEYVNDSYTMNYAVDNQRFVLSNPTVDTDSITVTVIEDNGATTLTYAYATSLYGLNSDSKVFFLQPAEDEKYEIVFGDNVTGRKPKNDATIVADYRLSSGELPNGCFKFTIDGAISGVSNVAVTTVTAAASGSVAESDASIKFNAPRHFSTQERAVTAQDYETLLKINFPEIAAISAYGGETVSPPQYGRVFIAVDIENVTGLPDGKIREYTDFILQRAPVSIEPIFTEPEELFVDVNTIVNYNINLTDLSQSDIRTLVITAISDFNVENLSNFKKTLRYSRLSDAIDNAHPSIVSNETTVKAIKKVVPNVNIAKDYDIDFDLPLQDNLGASSTATYDADVLRTIESTAFRYKGQSVQIEDNGEGTLFITEEADGESKRIEDIGTVDYATGRLLIKGLTVSSYEGSAIKFFARPKSLDIFSTKNVILKIDNADISTTINRVQI